MSTRRSDRAGKQERERTYPAGIRIPPPVEQPPPVSAHARLVVQHLRLARGRAGGPQRAHLLHAHLDVAVPAEVVVIFADSAFVGLRLLTHCARLGVRVGPEGTPRGVLYRG
ncbi:hypothetical protein ONZ51_g3638 [Trametes cubensis]|uniref:Uncharacterized protein n=1 Tax=Trametes cubensis TaxID=1111947 RepID=A0AAD7TXC7_9APHY|nr:hypothetical protein ONZ51_g3638 [Trametes cubensis]